LDKIVDGWNQLQVGSQIGNNILFLRKIFESSKNHNGCTDNQESVEGKVTPKVACYPEIVGMGGILSNFECLKGFGK